MHTAHDATGRRLIVTGSQKIILEFAAIMHRRGAVCLVSIAGGRR